MQQSNAITEPKMTVLNLGQFAAALSRNAPHVAPKYRAQGLRPQKLEEKL
jgi:hypothetical protein